MSPSFIAHYIIGFACNLVIQNQQHLVMYILYVMYCRNPLYFSKDSISKSIVKFLVSVQLSFVRYKDDC